jgi:S-layer homology domain
LLGGEAEIDEEGRVEIEVAGAAPSASYAVVYRSLDGAVQLAIGTLTTSAAGNGELKVSGVFLPGHVGAGSVVLRRLDADQFVTGFQALGARPRGLEAAVVGCAEVTTPAVLAGCGTDPLRTGKADIRLDGRVKVEVVGALPNATYTLLLRSPDGTTDQSLGTLATNPAGNGQLKIVGAFVPGDVGAGNLVLRRADADQFFSGFRIRTAHARRLEGALVPCGAVTRPAALAGCGTDPLLGGEVEIRPDGRVELEVLGAAPSASYAVVLLAGDGAAELALGTLATNAAGHGALKLRGAFAADAVGAGNVVLRRAGADQFVTGFRVQAFDVSDHHWAKRWIEGLFAARVTGGCASDPLLYCPESLVTRAQMAVFLLRGEHGAGFTPPAPVGRFRDVPAQHWAAGWIELLAAEGVTAGCGSQSFCPELTLSRAQMALFLLLARHGPTYRPPAPTGLFGDVPAGYWAAAWIEQLAREGITAGCRPGAFCPEDPVTRAQMAVFLLRTFGSTP